MDVYQEALEISRAEPSGQKTHLCDTGKTGKESRLGRVVRAEVTNELGVPQLVEKVPFAEDSQVAGVLTF